MPRRGTPQINAGSMADIAFLLLVFFLMVTQISSDKGIPTQLPPPLPEDFEPPDVRQQDVFVVLVNARNELLVEDDFMKIGELKEAAKKFMIANGVFRDFPISEDYPVRKWVRKAEITAKIEQAQAAIDTAPTEEHKKNATKAKEKLGYKLAAIDYFKSEYKELPGQALISLKNHTATEYNTYIQVNNELQSALNELRDEICLEHFGMTYTSLEDEYNRKRFDTDDPDGVAELRSRVKAVQAVYPQRISEAEPEQAQQYNQSNP